jgi:stage V sporulation protein R
MDEIDRLNFFNERIQEIAREFGLDFFPQEFDIVPAQKMLEILAYRFPVNFSHWSFGRDYEREKTQYDYGLGVTYEVVLNSNPSRAYLMNTNPFPIQVMVMAHVYAHNDFMKNNFHFKPTRKDMLPSASEAALRFQNYEKRFGADEVERVLDSALSIEQNIDPDFFIREESEEEKQERLALPPPAVWTPGQFEDLLPGRHRRARPEGRRRRTPPEPERDLLLYLIHHSPKPLREWEKDILSVVRDQSRYFMPQRRTKIMNEGWAAYWHMRIMDRLFEERLLNEDGHGFYNLYNARLLAINPRTINPYLMGLRIYEDVEERWNKGKFGKEWEQSRDPKNRAAWDLNLGLGRKKLFEVRHSYSDRFFVEHFLTKDLIRDLSLFLYEGQQESDEIKYVIREKDGLRIKRILVAHLSTFGIPLIYVEDGDYKGKREIYLKHAYDGIELDREYREKTIEHVYYLWDRPVHLESVWNGRKVVFTFDGTNHSQVTGDSYDDPPEVVLDPTYPSYI